MSAVLVTWWDLYQHIFYGRPLPAPAPAAKGGERSC